MVVHDVLSGDTFYWLGASGSPGSKIAWVSNGRLVGRNNPLWYWGRPIDDYSDRDRQVMAGSAQPSSEAERLAR